ncbi:MAG: sulfatase [Planctomycetota bacterium]
MLVQSRRSPLLVAALLALAACGAPDAGPVAPPVFVIVLDALGAKHVDHLGPEGLGVTPTLDALAADGVTCTQAFSPAPYTLAGIPSILTGRLPDNHRLVDPRQRLSQGEVTLAERLHDAGYETVAAIGNLNGSSAFGLMQGFDEAVDVFEPSARFPRTIGKGEAAYHLPRAPEFVDLTFDWLDGGLGAKAPPFVYLHLLEPHSPYYPPAPFLERFVDSAYEGPFAGGHTGAFKRSNEGAFEIDADDRRQALGLYRATLAFVDDELGRLFDGLRARGLYDESWIVVTSDHGEAFWEHGRWGHNTDLFEEMLHVPLIVKPPASEGLAGRRFEGFASTIDLVPTLVEGLGLGSASGVDGLALGASFRDPAAHPTRRELVLRTNHVAPHVGLRRVDGEQASKDILFRRQAARSRAKALEVVRTVRFDLRADPRERDDSQPVDRSARRRLRPWLDRTAVEIEQVLELTAQQDALLRDLGYTDD